MERDFDFEINNPKSSSERSSGYDPIQIYRKPEELRELFFSNAEKIENKTESNLALFQGGPIVLPIDPLCPIIRKPGKIYPECPSLPPLKLGNEYV